MKQYILMPLVAEPSLVFFFFFIMGGPPRRSLDNLHKYYTGPFVCVFVRALHFERARAGAAREAFRTPSIHNVSRS